MPTPRVVPPLDPLPEAVLAVVERVQAQPFPPLPEGMLRTPRPQRPFQHRPDPLLRAAGLWNAQGLIIALRNAWASRQHQPDPQAWFEYRVQQALGMVLQQVPTEVTAWNDRIGERLQTRDRPFSLAERAAGDQCVSVLLAFNPPVTGVVLDHAARLEHRAQPVFERLLRQPVQDLDVHGSPLLNRLAGSGITWALPLVVAAGADPNAGRDRPSAGDPDVAGETALGAAARMGQANASEALVALGADPRLMNDRGLSPSQVARERGFDALAQRLVQHEQHAWAQDMQPDHGVALTARARARL